MAAKKKEVQPLSRGINVKLVTTGELGVRFCRWRMISLDTGAGLKDDKKFLADMEKDLRDQICGMGHHCQDQERGVAGAARHHQDSQRRRCIGDVEEDFARSKCKLR